MDKLQAMHVFTRIVDANSFSRAADTLRLPRASVTAIIQRLEASLKVRLLNRTTRRLSLTADGAAYYECCVRILADIEETEQSLSSVAAAPRGKLRVDMPGSIGRLIVVPALYDFYARYPNIELMLGFGDKPVDLFQEGVDCVVRVGALEDSSLVARRIGTFEFVTAASPTYLRMYGEPMTIGDLPDHVAVNYFSALTHRIVNMNFVVDGKTVEVKMNSKLAANDADAYLNCGVKGLGLIQVPRILALPHLRDGELVEVLAHCRPLAMPISAVYPYHRHLSPHVRAFVGWVAELFERCPLLRCPLLIRREDSHVQRQTVPTPPTLPVQG